MIPPIFLTIEQYRRMRGWVCGDRIRLHQVEINNFADLCAAYIVYTDNKERRDD